MAEPVLEVYHLDFCSFLDLKRCSHLKSCIPDLGVLTLLILSLKRIEEFDSLQVISSSVVWDFTVCLVLQSQLSFAVLTNKPTHNQQRRVILFEHIDNKSRCLKVQTGTTTRTGREKGMIPNPTKQQMQSNNWSLPQLAEMETLHLTTRLRTNWIF